jgi:hypothetical protein
MFEIGGNTARLEFAEGMALAGSTVTVSLDMSVTEWLALQRTVAGLDRATDEQLAAMEGAFRHFGEKALVSWDLALNGNPLPATGDGMMRLPLRVANEIFSAWSAVTAAVSPNSNGVSPNGASVEALSAKTAA